MLAFFMFVFHSLKLFMIFKYLLLALLWVQDEKIWICFNFKGLMILLKKFYHPNFLNRIHIKLFDWDFYDVFSFSSFFLPPKCYLFVFIIELSFIFYFSLHWYDENLFPNQTSCGVKDPDRYCKSALVLSLDFLQLHHL